MFFFQTRRGLNRPILRLLWLMTSTAADVISVPSVLMYLNPLRRHDIERGGGGFDHCGAIQQIYLLFPNAAYWLQSEQIFYYVQFSITA